MLTVKTEHLLTCDGRRPCECRFPRPSCPHVDAVVPCTVQLTPTSEGALIAAAAHLSTVSGVIFTSPLFRSTSCS